ncbi:MAG: hypothetical protein IJY09_03395 [Lachnospiraceae bacterium]|nr:hypothetical protein [Lachnospiraceae bacterium]
MRRKNRKLIMNLCILIMGIGMLVFPLDTLPSMGRVKQPENTVDSNPSDAAGTEHITGSSPTITGASGTNAVTLTPTPTVTKAATPTPAPTLTPTPTVTPHLPPEENLLTAEVPTDIQELVTAYFESRLTSIEDYKKLIDNEDMVDEELTYKRVEYIVGFHNIVCYMQQGIEDIDYVVYAVYDAEIATISTYAPSIEYMLVRYDDNGVPKIYLPDENFSDAESNYLTSLIATSDVQLLIGDVNMALEAAKQSDADLMDLMKRIENLTEETE